MKYYIDNMIEEFPQEIKGQSKSLWNDKFLKVNKSVIKLDDKGKAIYHTFVINLMFLYKIARPDVDPVVSLLFTRTNNPNESSWVDFIRMLSFLKVTTDDLLRLEADDSQVLK